MDCNLLSSSVHGISQARIVGWVAISFSRGSSWMRDRTRISCIVCTGRRNLYYWASREAQQLFWQLLNMQYSIINCSLHAVHYTSMICSFKTQVCTFLSFSPIPHPIFHLWKPLTYSLCLRFIYLFISDYTCKGNHLVYVFLFCSFSSFGGIRRQAGSLFPNQGSHPCPLQSKCGILTTGPPGNFLFLF